MTAPKNRLREVLSVRALRTKQGNDVHVFAFFIPGSTLLQVAEISRVRREEDGSLHGFQRKEIRNHVRSIVEFLDQGPAIFPNAIILAISPQAEFTQSRGTKSTGDAGSSVSGTLRIPLAAHGDKAAWIVDGQQRAMALSLAKDTTLHVPVIAFVSEDLTVHREQFILVNKARPLPPRLINELLPEVDTVLPRDLAPRRIPSELVNKLNTSPSSPLFGLIRRPSDDSADAVIVDTALLKSIKNSVGSPLGALAPYKASSSRPADVESMYRVLVGYWDAVRRVFPDAWGLSPSQSRLMHSAGIEAMGYLMDRIMSRASATADLRAHFVEALARIAPHCRWTSGTWPELGREWNDFQSINRDIKQLSDQLARLDHLYAFQRVKF
jgi:DGQHR domain-containing protein